MRPYNKWEKFLHRFYLGNYFISRTSLTLESALYDLPKTNINNTYTYVTGLARSGTTAMTRLLYSSNNFASLTYKNMPLLLMPLTWPRFNEINNDLPLERSHRDGIMIDQKSPEAFEEYFWKVLLKDKFILSDRLERHDLTKQQIDEYHKYVALICKNQNRDRYLAKNNNLILRLSSLLKNEEDEHNHNTKVIIMIREPWQHAVSLLRKHQLFCKTQKEDPFILDYFNFLGHHEFGLNHKPIIFSALTQKDPDKIQYWLETWFQYYSNIKNMINDNCLFVSFESLCSQPTEISRKLHNFLDITDQLPVPQAYQPLTYPITSIGSDLYEQCQNLYDHITSFSKST